MSTPDLFKSFRAFLYTEKRSKKILPIEVEEEPNEWKTCVEFEQYLLRNGFSVRFPDEISCNECARNKKIVYDSKLEELEELEEYKQYLEESTSRKHRKKSKLISVNAELEKLKLSPLDLTPSLNIKFIVYLQEPIDWWGNWWIENHLSEARIPNITDMAWSKQYYCGNCGPETLGAIGCGGTCKARVFENGVEIVTCRLYDIGEYNRG